MIMKHLPDELIREILSPALQISLKDFADTSFVSPFFRFSLSTSTYLLVCKSWLRVATPLLYNVVVLRSTAQAKALERALSGNPLLGTFIKKLRLEGAFGSSIYRIIAHAENITHLWLSLSLVTGDSVSGLCRGLPLMNPTHVIASDPDVFSIEGRNSPTRKLIDTLSLCIETWSALETFEYPYMDFRSAKAYALVDGMTNSSSLKTVVLQHPQAHVLLCRTLLENRSIRTIRIAFKSTGDPLKDASAIWISRQLEPEFQQNEYFGGRVFLEYPDNETIDDTPDVPIQVPLQLRKCNPSFVPLQSTPVDIRKKIWNRILYFAMFVDEEEIGFVSRGGERTHLNESENSTRFGILLVSKLFHQLGRPHYYRCLIITSTSQLSHYAEILDSEPFLATHVRSIYIDLPFANFTAAAIHKLLSRTSKLLRLASPTIYAPRETRDVIKSPILTYRAFTTLATTAGSTLLQLSDLPIPPVNGRKPATPLFSFTALRHLEWNTPTSLVFDPATVPRDALANLEFLSCNSPNDTFLTLLGHMNLPALRHVSFPRPRETPGMDEFLDTHGSKLLSLETDFAHGVLTTCPSLRELCITGPAQYDSFVPHQNLRKITFTKKLSSKRAKTGYRFLGEIDFGTCPSLEEVVVHAIDWPTKEREIKKGYKAIWVTWTERLMEWNVKLTDADGRHWIPRLK